jgi:carboxymethylenebutenolidase
VCVDNLKQESWTVSLTTQRWTPLSAVLALLLPGAALAQSEGAAQAEQMHALHVHDAPDATPAALRPIRSAVDTQTITYTMIDGKAVRGFLARPAGAKKDIPGIVVVHEWWGLNDNIRAVTSQLAAEGYAALAVDLMGGGVASTPDSAQKLVRYAADQAPVTIANLTGAISYLRKEGATRIGTIGWCFGGHWSLRAGIAGGERVNAVVMYYGRPITDRATLEGLKAPLLGIFGSQDRGIPADSVRAMTATLDQLGRTQTVEFFDAGHGFANPSGRAYDAAAAEAAWSKTVGFFRKNL